MYLELTDYTHPFDGYKGQDVIIFEEFRSDLKNWWYVKIFRGLSNGITSKIFK